MFLTCVCFTSMGASSDEELKSVDPKLVAPESVDPKSVDPARRRPVQARSRKRFDAIVAAARELIGTRGLAPVSMTDIATHAGMSLTAVYRYFPNKRAVVRELALRVLESNAEMTSALVASAGDASPHAIIGRGVAHYLREQVRDPARLQIRAAIHADAELSALDLDDSRANAKRIAEALRELGVTEAPATLLRRCLLLVELLDPVVRLAARLDSDEGDAVIEAFAARASHLVLDSDVESDG